MCALVVVVAQVQPPPLLPGAPSAAVGAGPATRTGAISGVVTDATTGRPVAGAIVSLGRADSFTQGLPRVVTDSRGRFVFRDLPAASDYYLGARRFGYGYTRYGWTAPGGSLLTADVVRIEVADAQWVSNIEIPLWRLGSISGRVVDERNEPVVGVAVRAFGRASISGVPQFVAGPLATTDDLGVYRLSDLMPGQYTIAVLSVQSTVLMTTAEIPQIRSVGELESGGIGGSRGTGVAAPSVDVDGRHRLVLTNFATPPPPSSSRPQAYPPVFYPSALRAEDGVTLDLAYGESRSSVDIQLRPVPAVRVSGRLDGPAPLPPFLLRLMPQGSEPLGFGSEVATTVVERDGSFTFLNVPEGSYTVLAQATVMDFTSGDNSTARIPDAPGFPGGGITVGGMDGAPGLEYLTRHGQPSTLWGRQRISVGARDLDDVAIPLHPAVSVHGRLVFAEGTHQPNSAPMLLFAEPTSGDPSLGHPQGRTVPNDPTFAFTIGGLVAGSYVLNGWFASFTIVSITSDGRDVTDTGLDASLGHDFDNVVVTLTDKKTQITGFVTDARGSAAAAAVMAFPIERVRWANYGWTPARIQSRRASANGAFKLEGLPEGDYYLVAVDSAKVDAWTDPVFLGAAAAAATRVSLKWGETKSQDLTMVDVRIK